MPKTISAVSAILANQTNQPATVDPLLDSNEAASHLKIAPKTLAVWRCTKRYPIPFIKIGRSVRYRKSALDNFIEQRTRGAEV